MNETKNRVIEIDLLELLQEFKNNIGTIIGVTLLFAAAAAVYVFALTAPKYSYTQLVDCGSLREKDIHSFVSIFNEHSKVCELVKDQNSDTNLLKFEFQGTDPDLIKTECQAYTREALKKINDHIVKLHEIRYGKEYFDTVSKEIAKINSSLQDGSITSQGAAQYLQLLKERLELREKNKWLSLIKAELVPRRVDKAVKISRPQYITKSGLLGLFLSLTYLTGRYFRRLFKNQ
ncbi:MAG: hypothetical protein IKZ43_09495 [Acidaminococcaceae bacterium]|nr:hypothetical protein [Acidaminococcaceae bacterium]